jgi:ankyrin repeat protein
MKRGTPDMLPSRAGAFSRLLASPDEDVRPLSDGMLAVNAASPQARRVLSFSLPDGSGTGRLTLTTAPALSRGKTPVVAVTHIRVGDSALPAHDGAAHASSAPKPQAASRALGGPFSAWSRKHESPAASTGEQAPPSLPPPSPPEATPASVLARHAARQGPDSWLSTRLNLSESERIVYLVHSLPLAVEAGWQSAVDLIFREVSMERLLAQAWPDGARLPHLVLRLGCKNLTRSVLADRRIKTLLVHQDEQGMTPLHIAASMNDAEAACTIMNFRDRTESLVMKADAQGRLALHHAAQAGANRVAEHLLCCAAREQRCHAARGELALHIAVRYRQPGFAAILLREQAKEQLLAPDAGGRNALMQAVRWGVIDIVRQCLEAAAMREQLQARDSDGMSALDHARAAGNREVLARIEAAMRTAFPELADAPRSAGGSPQGGEDEDGRAAGAV